MRKQVQSAAAVIRYYAGRPDPDNGTSMADARIALCIAQGVDPDDIDPASGYDYSRRAYDNVRQSWIWNIKMHGFSDTYDRPHMNKALATWAAHRPDFTAGDDWLAEGSAAHITYWAGDGRSCSRSSCDLHERTAAQGQCSAAEAELAA